MDYHKACQDVLEAFSKRHISKEEAIKRIGQIDEQVYKEDPDTEPDGDSTYCCATAIEQIEGSMKHIGG